MTSDLWESRQVFWQDFLAASNYNRFAENLQMRSKFFRRYLRGKFSIAKFSFRQKAFGSRRRRVLLLPLAVSTSLPFFSRRDPNDIPEWGFLSENDQELLPKSLLKQLPSPHWRSQGLKTFSQIIPDSFCSPFESSNLFSDPCSNFEISMGAGWELGAELLLLLIWTRTPLH